MGNTASGLLISSSNNVIGGTIAAARNIISGNDRQYGVWLLGEGANNNLVQGNYIGTDANGTGALRNLIGVRIDNSQNNIIGGTTEGARNVISGNGGPAIWLETGANNNLVQGNYIGTDVNGTVALGNSSTGVVIQSSDNNAIGGTTPAARNIISANNGAGVGIGFSSTGNSVQGNYIGTDVTGTVALGNRTSGVGLTPSANNNTIGGTTTSARNIISGNGENGVRIAGGSTGNLVQGNYIGTDATGTVALGNRVFGVDIISSNNTIGSSSAGNTIAFNGFGAVDALFTGSADNVHIDGNSVRGDIRMQAASGASNTIIGNSQISPCAGAIRVRPSLAQTGTSQSGNNGFVPDAPQNLSVTGLTSTSATFNWGAVGEVTGYEVYLNSSLVATVGPGQTSVSRTGLSPGTNYSWRVRGLNATCAGEFSITVGFTTLPPPP